MNDTYTIKWRCLGSKEIHHSPSLFTRERAVYLVNMANEDFINAFHWMNKVEEV